MSYNNGFPTNQVYQQIQPIQQVGFTQYGQQQNLNQNQNMNQQVVQQPVQQSQQPLFNQVLDDQIKVNGIENAKLYPTAPNVTATLWDIDGKTFYRVSAGLPIKVYEYSEKNMNSDLDNVQIESNQSNFDFDEYVKYNELQDYVNQLIDAKLNTKVIEPQTTSSVKPTRTMNRKKGDK